MAQKYVNTRPEAERLRLEHNITGLWQRYTTALARVEGFKTLLKKNGVSNDGSTVRIEIEISKQLYERYLE